MSKQERIGQVRLGTYLVGPSRNVPFKTEQVQEKYVRARTCQVCPSDEALKVAVVLAHVHWVWSNIVASVPIADNCMCHNGAPATTTKRLSVHEL